MESLLYYNPNVAVHPEQYALQGMEKFSKFFLLYNPTVVPVDRTSTIKLPLHVRSLFPVPALRPVTTSFEELCDKRATELLTRADTLDVPIYVMWSGGIDSTLVLVSLLKNSTKEQRERITVLLSNESLREYPRFYEEHIVHQLKVDSSIAFPYILGRNALFISGEHNDQLFGSDVVVNIMMRFGAAFIHKPYDRDGISQYVDSKVNDQKTTSFYMDLFERVMNAAPIPIATNYDFFWWINFALKWQSVHMRTLAYVAARNVTEINEAYLRTRYAPFYCTEEFQLWSMLNPDKKIKDSWRTYKGECKDIIYTFTLDSDYRDNKTKRGSLFSLAVQQLSYNYINESFVFSENIDLKKVYRSDNDFL